MAAQTSRMESMALARVSEAPAATLKKAMEILVDCGQGEAVIAALDEAQQTLDRDDLVRYFQGEDDASEDDASEEFDRAAVGEQLLRKAPTDLVGEIQGFAAPAPLEPRRVRQKREHDAAVAARAPQVDEKERNGDRGEAARPVLELLRRRRAGDAVTIHAVEAALVDAADEEALHVWLQCAIRAPPHAVRGKTL